MYQLSILFLKFLIFSMIGYVVEMINCAIVEKRIANRGFFCGPYIPIYGIGSLLLIWVLSPIKDHIILVMLLSAIITTAIEYVTGYALEKIFHNKWWDYKDEKFNLHGRICLKNTILFGLGAPIILYILNPYMDEFLLQFKNSVLIGVSIVLFILFLLDVIYSCFVAYNLRHRLIIVEDLKNEKLTKIPGMLERVLRKRLKGMKKFPKRLLKAFPSLWKSHPKEFEIMKKIAIKEKKSKKTKKIREKKRK